MLTAYLHELPAGQTFKFPNRETLYEHRGNGWHQVAGRTETGGPWHSADTLVLTDVQCCWCDRFASGSINYAGADHPICGPCAHRV